MHTSPKTVSAISGASKVQSATSSRKSRSSSKASTFSSSGGPEYKNLLFGGEPTDTCTFLTEFGMKLYKSMEKLEYLAKVSSQSTTSEFRQSSRLSVPVWVSFHASSAIKRSFNDLLPSVSQIYFAFSFIPHIPAVYVATTLYEVISILGFLFDALIQISNSSSIPIDGYKL